jgi:hypothetical protein
MTAAADTTNSINYAKVPSSGAMYAPTGALASDIHGYVSGGFAGITESYTYNNRLELTAIQATSSAGTPLNFSYSYVTGNNGNIATQTNNASSGRSQSYSYDSLNRLLTAQAQSTSGGDCWGQSYGNGGPPSTMATGALSPNVGIRSTSYAALLPFPALLLSVIGLGSLNFKEHRHHRLLGGSASILFAALVGCTGGGGAQPPPTQHYTVTVTGTSASGSPQDLARVTLTVQ